MTERNIMGKPTKYKKYTAMSIYLPVNTILAAKNGNRQFTICLTAVSKKDVQEILNRETGCRFSINTLNEFNGLWINETFSFTPPSNGEVYFQNDHLGTPHYGEWLAFKDWKNKT
jgi:hypothetical protein